MRKNYGLNCGFLEDCEHEVIPHKEPPYQLKLKNCTEKELVVEYGLKEKYKLEKGKTINILCQEWESDFMICAKRVVCHFKVACGIIVERKEREEESFFLAQKNGMIEVYSQKPNEETSQDEEQLEPSPYMLWIANRTDYDLVIQIGEKVEHLKCGSTEGISIPEGKVVVYIDTESEFQKCELYDETFYGTVNGCCFKMNDGKLTLRGYVQGPGTTEPDLRYLYVLFDKNGERANIWCQYIDWRLD